MKYQVYENPSANEDIKVPFKGRTVMGPGGVWAPYIPVVTKTYINGEVVWYKNKFKNALLQIKFFFKKPVYQKNKTFSKYAEKTVNPSYYGKVNLPGVDNSLVKPSSPQLLCEACFKENCSGNCLWIVRILRKFKLVK